MELACVKVWSLKEQNGWMWASALLSLEQSMQEGGQGLWGGEWGPDGGGAGGQSEEVAFLSWGQQREAG